VKFLVDNQLPAALDAGLADATNAEIWEHASRNDCVVVSKDADSSLPGKRSRGEGWLAASE
jgi:predicted nuclease of predicted toxin-antitoxin system